MNPGLNSVDILIGQDNSAALISLEVKKGSDPDQPFTVKTLLGWSIHGGLNYPHTSNPSRSVFPSLYHPYCKIIPILLTLMGVNCNIF